MGNCTLQLMAKKSSARHKEQTLFHYIYKDLLDHLQYFADRSNISYILHQNKNTFWCNLHILQIPDTKKFYTIQLFSTNGHEGIRLYQTQVVLNVWI